MYFGEFDFAAPEGHQQPAHPQGQDHCVDAQARDFFMQILTAQPGEAAAEFTEEQVARIVEFVVAQPDQALIAYL